MPAEAESPRLSCEIYTLAFLVKDVLSMDIGAIYISVTGRFGNRILGYFSKTTFR